MILPRLMSYLFSALVWTRNWLFDHGMFKQHRLNGFVISVGNIAVGGTGKSPIVIDLARQIIAQGGQPAIVSRGYKSGLRAGEWQALVAGRVVAGCARPGIVADEARMQSLALPAVPVVVGQRRWAAVRDFEGCYSGGRVTHWILDDGFQHRMITRDYDLVVLDARSPFGPLLPAGLFREPRSALRRAHGVVITKATDPSQVARIRGDVSRLSARCEVFEASFLPDSPLHVAGPQAPSSARWAMVCGIARPEDFENGLAKVGIQPARTFIYRDHESFSLPDLRAAMGDFDAIVTTEKDWARDEESYRSLNYPVFTLPQRVEWKSGLVPSLRAR